MASVLCVPVQSWVFHELAQGYDPWPNPKLIQWHTEGRKPFLSRREIACANGGEGFDLIVVHLAWDKRISPRDAATVRLATLDEFLKRYGGHRFKRIFAVCAHELLSEGCRDAGYRQISGFDEWACAHHMTDNPNRPILWGAEPSDAFMRVNSFLTRFFDYREPVCGLSASQIEVLKLALEGLSDAEIACRLCLTQDAVKARWRVVYRKVDAALPALLPRNDSGSRGIEKRRILLSWLKNNPSEMTAGS
jgi:hypothetical protein